MLKNIELAEHQKKRWRRTYKANLSLHSDHNELNEVVFKQINELSGSSLSSRLLIEMALCECPLHNGNILGIMDIQELLCFASMMHYFGGISDAIKYESITPKLVISAFGDVMFEHDYNDDVYEPFISNFHAVDLKWSVDNYSRHLVENEPVKAVNHLLEDNFNNSWFEEFGFTFDDARLFIDIIEDFGLKQNKLVYEILYDDLLKLFDQGFIEIAKRIIKELEIYPRDSWTDIPKPFKKNDWEPWRFRRRYSVSYRPIVRTSDKKFIVSPEQIRRSFIYLARSCHSADLDENHFSSKLMRKWVGKTRAKAGLSFNSKVAEKFKKSGWNVKEEIKLSEILNLKLDKDYGDVDVLAWNKEKNIIAVIECKDLEFAKTQGEIAKQAYEFKGQVNSKGKNDRLIKHVIRMNALTEHLDKVSRFTGIKENPNIYGYIVFSNIVPMVFDNNRLHRDLIEFLTFEELDSFINSN